MSNLWEITWSVCPSALVEGRRADERNGDAELTQSHRLNLACACVCEASCWRAAQEKSRNTELAEKTSVHELLEKMYIPT